MATPSRRFIRPVLAKYNVLNQSTGFTVSYFPPRFRPDARSAQGALQLQRRGAFFFRFFPRDTEGNWDEATATAFALTPKEMASFIHHAGKEDVYFTHEGTDGVTKRFEVASTDHDGAKFILSVGDEDRRIVDVDGEDVTLLVQLMKDTLSHATGFAHAADPRLVNPMNLSKARNDMTGIRENLPYE